MNAIAEIPGQHLLLGRLPLTVCGDPMIRISLSYVYNFATSVEPLLAIKPETPYLDSWFELTFAQTAIDELINTSLFAYSIRSARQPSHTLMQLLKKYTDTADQGKKFELFEVQHIARTFTQFKTVLLAEMETLNANFVTQKRDTTPPR